MTEARHLSMPGFKLKINNNIRIRQIKQNQRNILFDIPKRIYIRMQGMQTTYNNILWLISAKRRSF